MFNRTQACAALIICTSVAFAQEASTPTYDISTAPLLTSPAPSSGMEIPVNNFGTQSGTDALVTPEQTPKPADAEKEGFSLPGGFGYAPVDFTPGEGKFDRKPLSFSTTIQQAYDDNIYSSSGAPLQSPIKGSMLTHLSQAAELLISQSRLGLSLDANGGGQYYWDRTGDKLTPNGSLDLVFAYKLTPQAQFSAIVNGAYTTQPNLSVLNGLTQSTNTGYLQINSKFDLLYRWTPRFSTDTTYTVNSVVNQDSEFKNNDYTSQTLGQSFRYAFSRLMTGVMEGRFSQNSRESSTFDSNTYYGLVGADITLTRRLMGSFRVGETTQTYQTEGLSSSTLPYFETSLNYNLTKKSFITLDGRYGFDNTDVNGKSRKSLRTGLSFTQLLSSRLRATAGINYSNTSYDQLDFLGDSIASTDKAISGNLGFQYTLSQDWLLFGNINRLKSIPADSTSGYTKNTYYLGATFQY